MNIFDLLELTQAKAILSKIRPNESSVWRGIMREYSKTFHVPLTEVPKLDPEEVLLNLYENQMDSLDLDEDKDFNRLMEKLYLLDDPEYDAQRDRDEEAANLLILEEENQKIAEKALKKKSKEVKKELPLSGGLNLAYLADNQKEEG